MGSFYDAGPYGIYIFLLTTVVLGGAAAFVSGRALAQTWRPFLQLLTYCLLLGCAVRFIQYAIFQQPLLSASNYVIDFAVLYAMGVVGYKLTRRAQMEQQYGWRGTGTTGTSA